MATPQQQEDPSLDQLQQRWQSVRTDRRTSTPSSPDRRGGPAALSALLGSVLESVGTRWVCCMKCRGEWVQSRIGSAWTPECPVCHPRRAEVVLPPRPAEPAPPEYSGDLLLDLREAGVNVHKFGDASLERATDEADPAAVINHDRQAIEAVQLWIRSEWENPRRRRFPPRDWMFFYGDGSERVEAVNYGRIEEEVRIGSLGNGKTFLAVATAVHLIQRGLLRPRDFRFITVERFLMEAEATWKNDETQKALIRRYEDPELLILDELGIRTDVSPHAMRVLDELTKAREAKATIWTSNLSIPTLTGTKDTMKRIADRILGECGDGSVYRVAFSGPSRRKERARRK